MKYVMIEFDDDGKAEGFIKKIEASAAPDYRVAAVYQEPKTYCVCPITDNYHKNQVSRGAKFGWWVHTNCRKPRKGGHQLQNLLPIGDRRYHKTAGFVYYPQSLSVMDIPVQNITLRGEEK
jgi:hypothetical protein